MAYEKIKFDDIERIDFIVTKGMTARQVYNKYKPDYILNGALYDMATKTNITNALDEGKKSGYLFSSEGLAINGQKHVVWVSEKEAKSSNYRDYIAGSPTLVKNGQKFVSWGNKYSSYVDGSHKRSVIGFNSTHLFLLASDYNNTISGLANYCINAGMQYAINLDGGGSCHLQKGTKAIKRSGRANVSWILVYLKKKG